MIYALWEIVLPLIAVFVIGLALGVWLQRSKGTPVSVEDWEYLRQRARAADRLEAETPRRAPEAAEIEELRAALDVRDIEIAQLRKAISDDGSAYS